MLVIRRRAHESFQIKIPGEVEPVLVMVMDISEVAIHLGIGAGQGVLILRDELCEEDTRRMVARQRERAAQSHRERQERIEDQQRQRH